MAAPLAAPVDAPVTLYLVRHGEAQGAEGRCVGHTDLPLAPAGRDALARLAATWTLPRPPLLMSSDLLRARESARLLAGGWGMAPPIRTDPRLREMHFGRWDGRTWEELERDDGVALGAWMADWQEARTPGGEGFGDVVARAGAWLRDAAEAGRADGHDVVAVAHAGFIRALLVHAIGLTRESAFRMRVDHAGVTAVRVGGRGHEALFVNAGVEGSGLGRRDG